MLRSVFRLMLYMLAACNIKPIQNIRSHNYFITAKVILCTVGCALTQRYNVMLKIHSLEKS